MTVATYSPAMHISVIRRYLEHRQRRLRFDRADREEVTALHEAARHLDALEKLIREGQA